MLIGIDLDNTLACYDGLFHAAAMARGLIDASVGRSKADVREALQTAGQNDTWTELQGYIYGPGMRQARPFAGAGEFLDRLLRNGGQAAVISHRTRTPYRGEPHDLHAAAHEWLAAHHLVGSSGATALPPQHVFLETSKEAKLARIESLGCSHFIDDLPEILAAETFPAGVERMLFQPAAASATPAGPWTVVRSWPEISQLLLGGVAA